MSMNLAKCYKPSGNTNPIFTQHFGADPYAMVYKDRVYFYMTADKYEYDKDGNIIENSYSKIDSIYVVSTDDFVNFTDHGEIHVAGPDGVAKWATNSWAPAACWKEINGKDKFFLYFADNAGGIGVISSDCPYEGFEDPLGHGLILKSTTPTCDTVEWLFDPAVLMDDDGSAYIYFGGGVPRGQFANPATARVCKLGADMISLEGKPNIIDPPYLFEDSGIHKFNNKYYYTYCTNFNVDAAGTQKFGFENGEICVMESDNPMGPFVFKEKILENPVKKFVLGGNNHHCVFFFNNQWYMTYHTRGLEYDMGICKGYRITHIDEFDIAPDGTIGIIEQTKDKRKQIKPFNPFEEHPSVCVSCMAGCDAKFDPAVKTMVVNGFSEGSFVRISGADFKNGGKHKAVLKLKNDSTDNVCIEMKANEASNDVWGKFEVANTDGEYTTFEADIDIKTQGATDVVFVCTKGSNASLLSWYVR